MRGLAALALMSCLIEAAISAAQSPNVAVQQNLLQRQQQLEAFQSRGEQFKQLLQPGLTAAQKAAVSRQHVIQQQDQLLLQSRQQQQLDALGTAGIAQPLSAQQRQLELQQLQFAREREEQQDAVSPRREQDAR